MSQAVTLAVIDAQIHALTTAVKMCAQVAGDLRRNDKQAEAEGAKLCAEAIRVVMHALESDRQKAEALKP